MAVSESTVYSYRVVDYLIQRDFIIYGQLLCIQGSCSVLKQLRQTTAGERAATPLTRRRRPVTAVGVDRHVPLSSSHLSLSTCYTPPHHLNTGRPTSIIQVHLYALWPSLTLC